MYSIYEKLVELCPIIKELLADEGIYKVPNAGVSALQGAMQNVGGAGVAAINNLPPRNEQFEQQNKVMNEMLARLVNLQQFVQGGHGSKSRAYQPQAPNASYNPNDMQAQSLGGYGVDIGQETSLYEEMRMMKATQQAILSQIGGVAEATTQVAQTVAEEPELKSLTLEGVSLTLKDVNLTLPSQQRDKEREAARDKTFGSVD